MMQGGRKQHGVCCDGGGGPTGSSSSSSSNRRDDIGRDDNKTRRRWEGDDDCDRSFRPGLDFHTKLLKIKDKFQMAWMEQETLGLESTHSKLLSLQSSLLSSPSDLLSFQSSLLASDALARERRAFCYNEGMAAIDRSISLSLRILQQQRSDPVFERNQLELLKGRNKLLLVAMEQETKGQEITQEKMHASHSLTQEKMHASHSLTQEKMHASHSLTQEKMYASHSLTQEKMHASHSLTQEKMYATHSLASDRRAGICKDGLDGFTQIQNYRSLSRRNLPDINEERELTPAEMPADDGPFAAAAASASASAASAKKSTASTSGGHKRPAADSAFPAAAADSIGRTKKGTVSTSCPLAGSSPLLDRQQQRSDHQGRSDHGRQIGSPPKRQLITNFTEAFDDAGNPERLKDMKTVLKSLTKLTSDALQEILRVIGGLGHHDVGQRFKDQNDDGNERAMKKAIIRKIISLPRSDIRSILTYSLLEYEEIDDESEFGGGCENLPLVDDLDKDGWISRLCQAFATNVDSTAASEAASSLNPTDSTAPEAASVLKPTQMLTASASMSKPTAWSSAEAASASSTGNELGLTSHRATTKVETRGEETTSKKSFFRHMAVNESDQTAHLAATKKEPNLEEPTNEEETRSRLGTSLPDDIDVLADDSHFFQRMTSDQKVILGMSEEQQKAAVKDGRFTEEQIGRTIKNYKYDHRRITIRRTEEEGSVTSGVAGAKDSYHWGEDGNIHLDDWEPREEPRPPAEPHRPAEPAGEVELVNHDDSFLAAGGGFSPAEPDPPATAVVERQFTSGTTIGVGSIVQRTNKEENRRWQVESRRAGDTSKATSKATSTTWWIVSLDDRHDRTFAAEKYLVSAD